MKNEKIARIIAVVMCALALILVIGIGVGAMNTISNVATGGTGGACAHKNLKRSPQNDPLNHVNHLVLVECATCGQDMQNVYEEHDYAVGKCAVCDHACLHSAGNIVTYAYKGNGEHYVYTRCEICRKASTYTTAACQLNDIGVCTLCEVGCAHEDVTVSGETAMCNICGKDLVTAQIIIDQDPGEDVLNLVSQIYFCPGATWRQNRSSVVGLGYTFGPGAAGVVYMIYDGNVSFGVLTLNGAEVTLDDLLVEGAEYYIEKF